MGNNHMLIQNLPEYGNQRMLKRRKPRATLGIPEKRNAHDARLIIQFN
jgi:hypothetical protein